MLKMTTEILNPVLVAPISSLELSDEFKKMAVRNGYETLQDILNEPITNLPSKPGSGFRTLKELIAFLSSYGLDQLTED